MRAAIVCVGRLKEEYLKKACQEYEKRLSRYGSVEIIELKDEPEPANGGAALEKRVLDLEGERILSKVKPGDYVVALAIDGREYSSKAFAAQLDKISQLGRVVFVIGGSLGLSQAVYARADERLSFSKMTFPHQLMRVILLEQLYRSCRINGGEPYHK